MFIFANGSSWTWGGGGHPIPRGVHVSDDDRVNVLWPHFLGQLCGIPSLNYASSGGSNHKICRTTYDWFLNNYDPNIKTIAIIQFTHNSRYEYYESDNLLDFTNDPKLWATIIPGKTWSQKKEHFLLQQMKNQSRLSTYTEIEGMYTHLNECGSLAFLFKSLNVPYIFWNSHSMIDSYPSVYANYFRKFNYYNISNEWQYDRVSEKDLHPNENGHRQIAQIIYDIIKPLINL